MTAVTHSPPAPHEVLAFDLPEGVEMPALDEFTLGGTRGIIPLGQAQVHIQWGFNHLDILFQQQIYEVRLREYFATHEDQDCYQWRGCTEIGKRRIGGRLAHFKHVWIADMTERSHTCPPKDLQGTHIWVWCLPIDRGTNKMQIALKKRGLRPDNTLDACWPEVLDRLRLHPPASGHLLNPDAAFEGGTLRISAVNVPKITRPWGSFQPKMQARSPHWELVLRHPDYERRLSLFPRGSSLADKLDEIRRSADRWSPVLSDLSNWMSRIETELQREAAEYECGVTFSDRDEVYWSANFENRGRLLLFSYSRYRREGDLDHGMEGTATLTPGGKLKTKLH